MMKNRMQDLDFEQTVAFDSVKDFEFTRRAAQRFRQVVSLDGFEDEDADVIFHYLYKEMELVSFGDHLKRYIYERAANGNLNFNWLLILAPPEVLDYVVVHELCHRMEMNHSQAFWKEVEKILPDYQERQKWLKDNGWRLMEEGL